MGKSTFDLKSGHEKYLALAFGKHLVTGHPVEHAIGVEGGAATNLASADSRYVLKQVMGDGALDVDGEGAWCGPAIEVETACSFGRTRMLEQFTRDDEAEDLGIAPNGQPWVQISGIWGIESNEAFIDVVTNGSADGRSVAVVETGISNGSFAVRIPDKSAGGTTFNLANYGPVFRFVDINNYWYLAYRGALDSIVLHKILGGVHIGSAESDSALGFADNDVIEARCCGNSIKAYWNGSFLFEVIDADMMTATKAGLFAGSGVVTPPQPYRFDDFTVKEQGASIEPGNNCGLEVIYAGETIPEENVHYHPGTLSTGKDDPIQGIDSFFPGGLTYNASPHLAVALPEGIDEDADPSKLAAIVSTSQVGDYDEDGNRTAISYSPNPSRVRANLLRRVGQHNRIYWPSYIHSRDWYDEEIEAPVGNENSYDPFDDAPTYDTTGPIAADAGTGAIDRTGGGPGYDNRALTRERIVGGQNGSFSITIGAAFPTGTGGGEMHLVDENGNGWFGISWGNGHISVFANEVAIDDATIPYDLPAVNGDEIELVVDDGFFLLKQNGVTKAIPQGEAPAPDDVDLFGRIILWAAGAELSASHLVGQTVAETTESTEMIPRFEAHPAFTGPVDIGTALDHVDLLSCSDTQEAGRYIIFQTPEERDSSHTFDNQTNIVAGSIKVWKTDIRQRPSRLWAKYRNLNLHYLDEDSTDDKRDELFDKVGRPIDPGPYVFGPMRPSQAQRTIKFLMKGRSDDVIWCQLTGMDDSWKLVSGDVATVVIEELDRVPKDFLVISATRESPEQLPTGMRRVFVLQEYHVNYSDTDHEVSQRPIVSRPPSQFAAPPAPVLLLAQRTVESIGGTFVTKIIGTVYFANFPRSQTAKIYVTRPDSATEVYTGFEVTPAAGTNQATFEYVPDVLGLYVFRAEAWSSVVGGSDSEEILIADIIFNPDTEALLLNPDTGLLLLAR